MKSYIPREISSCFRIFSEINFQPSEFQPQQDFI